MFEQAEQEESLSKSAYKVAEADLRDSLLAAQYRERQHATRSVIIIVGGVDGAGKGETVNLFNEWMDPRYISTHGFGEPSPEAATRPPMWRFWQALPPKGAMAMLFGSWYTQPIVSAVEDHSDDDSFDRAMQEIRDFENTLTASGTVIVKLWFHLSEKAQKKRLEELESDPRTRWRVTDTDWKRFKSYKKFRAISERALKATSTENAPWHVINGSCRYSRALNAGRYVLQALEKSASGVTTEEMVSVTYSPKKSASVLDNIDYSAQLPHKSYKDDLEKWQGRLALLLRQPAFKKYSFVIAFEGQDAAGKGGAIRRITSALDARQYRVVPIAAPNEQERAQHWLWRFWRELPAKGYVTLFDRSWYGRVLVERVEGFAAAHEWQRAYHEIRQFEKQLTDNNVIVVKFWLAITKDEQLKRFRERESVSFKNYKITDEDWRNREKWADYAEAVDDMIQETDGIEAPWHMISANDVEYARIEVLKRLCTSLETALSAE